ncbi:MAG: mechanosensitive ion channel family protein [Nodosilinea sp.]
MSIRKSRRLSFVLACLLALGISLAAGQPSLAQFALPEGLGLGDATASPPGVTRYGNIEVIAVESPLSNLTLFTIASPTVYDRSTIGEQIPVEQRAAAIRDKLLLLIERPMDPETLVFEVSTLRNFTVIDVRDAKFSEPLILATVTEYDANYAGVSIDTLAGAWRDTLEADLRHRLITLPESGRRVGTIVTALTLLSAAIFGLKYAILQRQKQLRRRKKAITAELEDAATAKEFQTEAGPESIHRQAEQKQANLLQEPQPIFTLDRRLSVLAFIQWLLFWLVVFAWYAGAAWVAWKYPYILLNSPIGQPLRVVIDLLTFWFFTGLAIRVCRRLIDHFATEREGLDLGDLMAFGNSDRRHLRASTVAGAAKGLITVVLVLTGVLLALQYLDVPTASLVAITSVAGLAITFGSQNLVKDLVNGFFILAEDQYAVGDVIDIGSAAGLVENLNLRITQLRSGNGDLVTIPNSSITQVKNSTRNWSRVLFSINVAYETDPDKALDVLKEVAQTFYNDSEWHSTMLTEPAVLGIEEVSNRAMTINTSIQTEPAQQWAVGREWRLRVRRALAGHGIAAGP